MRKGLKIAALVAISLTFAGIAAPASAQGIFESLFGGLRRAVRSVPAEVSSFADPFEGMRRSSEPPVTRGEGSPVSGYCVRTCDGHYFPVHAQGSMSSADMCSAFCPASETKVYSGGAIDNASTRDGSRYSDLPNAFVYRKQLVAGCTCNGKSAFGLVNLDVKTDPTLRQGDIVATANGLSAYTGAKNQTAEFTPISNYRALPQSYRDKLLATKVAPENAMAMAPVTLAPHKRKPETTGRAYNEPRPTDED
jgi:hypothetical protein